MLKLPSFIVRFLPAKRLAEKKRRLQRICQEHGLSKSKSLHVVSRYFSKGAVDD